MPYRLAVFVFFLAGVTGTAEAFPTQNDNTPGTRANAYRQKNNIWSRLDVGVVDAKVKTTPPDTVKFDRRAETLAIFGFDVVFTRRLGMRTNLEAEVVRRRESEESEPRADIDETVTTYTPSIDLTFITDKGLEIFGGVQMRMTPSYEQTVTTATTDSVTEYGDAKVQSNRVGVVRRAGVWSGGFYYVLGGESDRSFVKTAETDGSSVSGSETVFIPPGVGVFGEFDAKGAVWDFELNFIQARGKGPRDDTGATVFTDHFQARGGALFEFGGALGLKTSLTHRTLSYSDNAFVTVDRIPISSLKVLGVLGDHQSHAYFGIIGAYGEDGQSLPEFNAEYELIGLAGTVGLFFPL